MGDCVSNHQPHDCLLNRLFRRRSKKTSKLRVTGLCAGNSPGTGEFYAQLASNTEMFPFDDVIMGRQQSRSLIVSQSSAPWCEVLDIFGVFNFVFWILLHWLVNTGPKKVLRSSLLMTSQAKNHYHGNSCVGSRTDDMVTYRQTSNRVRTKSQNLNVSRLILKLSLPIDPLKPGVKSRCSWSITDRRCSNYIWVINNFIPY